MVLSQSRADMVKTYMVKQGIDESRIKTVTYGETMPLEDNTTVEGKQLNRRVEINILNNCIIKNSMACIHTCLQMTKQITVVFQ